MGVTGKASRVTSRVHADRATETPLEDHLVASDRGRALLSAPEWKGLQGQRKTHVPQQGRRGEAEGF